MVGAEPHEQQGQAQQSGQNKQGPVGPTRHLLLPCQQRNSHKHNCKHHHWRETARQRGTLFGQELHGLVDNGAVRAFGVSACIDVVHDDGEEHALDVGATVVGREAKEEVDAESPPLEGALEFVGNPAAIGPHGALIVSNKRISMSQRQAHHVADAGGTVVAEEIVAVVSVLGLVVPFEHEIEVVDLLWGEVQPLFPYGAAVIDILLHEAIE